MTIAYDGSTFHGWQKQKATCGEPDVIPVRTVASVVEHALVQVLKQPVEVVGASRTDAGVHAQGQVAHFDAASRVPEDRLAAAINSRLPNDVEVLNVEPAQPDFNAIRSAVCKQYRYRIFNSAHRPLGLRHLVWHCWRTLELERMQEAATRLVGRYDYRGFSVVDQKRATTVRTIFSCEVARDDPELQIIVQGDGFLYHMVRVIAGTLVEVGRGRFAAEVIDRILASQDRSLAGPTLPASGLCLEWIKY